MWPLIVAGVLVLAVLVGCSRRVKPEDADGEQQAPNPTVSSYRLVSWTRKDIEKRLAGLAKTPAPRNLAPGAMCYKVAAPPRRAQYVCPRCGSRTLYVEDMARTVEWEVPACRRAVKTVKGLDVSLDESEFCRKCRPKVEKPRLVLLVQYEGENKPHRARGIDHQDVVLIAELINGAAKHKGDRDAETPLKDHVPRLRALLGIEETEGTKDNGREH